MAGRLFVKRAADLGLCLVALPVVALLCLPIMAIIRLESRGAPLFIQTRVGRDGTTFRMLKLRTMATNTGDVPSHMVGTNSITRVGGVLRKLKLDELPQLLNVISGSMSLVGPRPCLPTQVELIEERAARNVLQYRPGITGPAQLQGVDMSQPKRAAEIEAAYFAKATILNDFVLIWKTLMGSGAGDAASKASL